MPRNKVKGDGLCSPLDDGDEHLSGARKTHRRSGNDVSPLHCSNRRDAMRDRDALTGSYRSPRSGVAAQSHLRGSKAIAT